MPHTEPFKADMEAIRTRARTNMQRGAVTAAYGADPNQVIQVLNDVLATELVCHLRYLNHYYMAAGKLSEPIADEFWEHAEDEKSHAYMVAERITQLGGMPDMDPAGLSQRSHADYVTGVTLDDMIREDLIAERIAIETYSEVVRWLSDRDPSSRRMMEEILSKEEEHAKDLADLIGRLES